MHAGTGGCLFIIYRIHLLEIITVDFLIVPILMTGGGLLTLIIFFTGMTALAKEDNCWLLAFSILTSLNFFVLLAGVISSIRSGSGGSWNSGGMFTNEIGGCMKRVSYSVDDM